MLVQVQLAANPLDIKSYIALSERVFFISDPFLKSDVHQLSHQFLELETKRRGHER